MDEVKEFLLGTRTSGVGDRQVVTVLFTNGSAPPPRAAGLGDRRGHQLKAHRESTRRLFERFGGREIDTAGDGFLIAFATPTSALAGADEVLVTVPGQWQVLRAEPEPA